MTAAYQELATVKHRILLIVFFSALVIAAGWTGWRMQRNSACDKRLKADYFRVNQIKYGLLSGNNWTYQVNRIVAEKIDSFAIEGENAELLKAQVSSLLHRLFDEAEAVLSRERKTLGEKIRYGVINSLVEVDHFRAEIPRLSQAIVDELEKSKYRAQLKTMVKEKVTGVLSAANQDTLGEKGSILRKYSRNSVHVFNRDIARRADALRSEQKKLGYCMIAVLVAALLAWLYVFRVKTFYAGAFLFSVVLSCLALFTGISLPMIEIDARITELRLTLMGSQIAFHDQVIFYQAKSILDVVKILLTDGKADTVLVGFLIFLFSVLFPLTKLVSTTVYLYRNERSGRFAKFMAFYSGKWSMADVMVVAIFMAYVGFKGIIDNQLADIKVQNDTVNVLTTNGTNLQTGYLVFVAFVLFSLILAEILKQISKAQR